MSDIIPFSNVRSIVKDDKMAILNNPTQCLATLRNYAGSIDAFVSFFGVRTTEERQWVLFQAVTTMKTDEKLHKDWEEAKRQNREVRFDLLRDEALKRLEDNYVGTIEKVDERKGTITYIHKERDDLAFGKFFLGDDLAGRIADAKSRPTSGKGKPAGDDQDDEDDGDEEALKRAAGGA